MRFCCGEGRRHVGAGRWLRRVRDAGTHKYVVQYCHRKAAKCEIGWGRSAGRCPVDLAKLGQGPAESEGRALSLR